jgi:diguanylate cyclase (GGDEF)-like protein
MTRRAPAVWVGRGIALLGLAAVAPAIAAAGGWAVLAAAGGVLAALGFALAPLVRVWLGEAPAVRPSDFGHTLELLCRAHDARAGWLVGLAGGDVEVRRGEDVGRAARERGAALVQLASVDGRTHVAREPAGTYVAVGDFPFGAGVLLAQAEASAAAAQAAADDLRRVVAGLRLAERQEESERPSELVARQLAALVGGAQTLEGIARAGVTLAQQVTERATAIVMPGGGGAGGAGATGATGAAGGARVVAVSAAGDGRLAGLVLAPEAPAVRAIATGVPVVTHGAEDVFGAALPDRRRRDRGGTAYPLRDGHFVIGALVVAGARLPSDGPVAEQLQRLLAELGPRLAAARAVHEAEQRAVRDPLTGLRNRREFERALVQSAGAQRLAAATLVYVDLDHFKALNDTLGHAAGDAALRHVARILEGAVRDRDLVARIGGEEFAIWMPETPLAVGVEVAERIRATVAGTAWQWGGVPHPLTISCGVAAYPETVGEIANLRGAADAALYRAKEAGRNRVEHARVEKPPSSR